jgi:phosphatidylserine/phosphatidylglycerophosphate/cardiolipin synthase-like enzyme
MKANTIIIAMLIAVAQTHAQNIKVYFNQSVDNSVSSITDAYTSSHLDDTICSLINSAANSIDLAVWDNGSSNIVNALNNAYNRGVVVRYISSTNSSNSALPGLNINIPLLKRTAVLTNHVMHNKFIIVDNLHLLTGSMNFGTGSIVNDYNNIVIIDDAAIAQNYRTEFNEMWGSAGAQPNISTSKFGSDKTDNTVHSFNVGSTIVQSYFSPSDHTTDQIINAINSADYTLDIAIFTFINNDLGDAVVAAKNRGVNVRCIIENVSYIGSEYSKLVAHGIPVLSEENIPYDFHHKYCIVDAQQVSSDPIVVTGSHNWTNSSETDYDENTLIIHSEIIANQYLEEFTKRYSLMGITKIKEVEESEDVKIFPNPGNGNFLIRGLSGNTYNLDVTDYSGRLVYHLEENSTNEWLHLDLKKGLYFLYITTESSRTSEKIVIE